MNNLNFYQISVHVEICSYTVLHRIGEMVLIIFIYKFSFCPVFSIKLSFYQRYESSLKLAEV